ncbi:MAG: DEAD/DEAH box helicase family protein [Rickettsiales bacterium]|nr:DEAD/DEAH box helicase family protein [Rickettsiales bacterium]
MSDIKNLYETIGDKAYRLRLPFPEIPKYISENLKYDFFDWQKTAFENFLTFEAIKEAENSKLPTHLMFNMATGTGKTLLMAASILHYYRKGYRHFIFFVNQNNIIDKTENNFIQSSHNKYLFKDKIVIDDQTVLIKKIESFSDNPQGIEIKFTSIQKLYNDIHLEKENKTSLQDLHRKNIVMLADEAHHLNTDTKTKKGENFDLDLSGELAGNASAKDIEKKGWEHTVIELVLNKNGQEKNNEENNKNVLLEFTATIPENKEIEKKYSDKIIAKFTLKEFLGAGYTKEINLVSSNVEKKNRILLALLFHYYRHKIALKNGIANFKPVMLFRSKTIEESKNDYEEFLNLTANLKADDFDFLKEIHDKIDESKNVNEQGKLRVKQILQFIQKEKISYFEVANFIKDNFASQTVIITNSKQGTKTKESTTEDQEKLLNSLEDKNNNIRAIFTVARLNEGWDVLNLFDIVRLYEGRDEGKDDKGNRKAGNSTISEKQLIGRGIRYFPFNYSNKIKNKRKFDDDLENELRILEELCFYSTNEHRYIDELKRELKKDGYTKDDRTIKTFDLKPEFKASEFYQKVKIWKNKSIENPNRRKATLEDLQANFTFEYAVKSLEFREDSKIFNEEQKTNKINENTYQTNFIKFNDIEKHIFRKAVAIKAKQDGSLLRFENLSKELKIESINDLQKIIIGDFKIKIISKKDIIFEDISSQEKLDLTLKFLEEFLKKLKSDIVSNIGSEKFFAHSFAEIFGEPKTKSIKPENEDKSIVSDNKWYVLDGFVGTSEEKKLVEFIKKTIGNLEEKYSQIYLLRNEEIYKIFDFKQARGFQPDFLLFLEGKDSFYYQIFIEPKGNWAKDKNNGFEDSGESWKEDFLKEISAKYGDGNIIKAENRKYKLIGLPFYNEKDEQDFGKDFLEKITN